VKNFADRLNAAIEKKGTCAIVGIDPRLELIPETVKNEAGCKSPTGLEGAANAVLAFSRGVIDAVADVVPAVKPQSAFFELYGWPGVRAYAETIEYARAKGLIVISDVKRGDIGSTAAAYANAYLGKPEGVDAFPFNADAVTVNPYLGTDGLKPFAEAAAAEGRGVFVLARTSNPSAGELQNADNDGEPVYLTAARLAASLGKGLTGEYGFSSVGIVAGATFPGEAAELRGELPDTLFLVPGYGAQGAGAADLAPFFTPEGKGVIVNASRSVIFAYTREPYDKTHGEAGWKEAVRAAAVEMKKDLAGIGFQSRGL
jgi:orotidine-5'-phosphate decarboxylase